MLSVPRRANDAMYLAMIKGFDVSIHIFYRQLDFRSEPESCLAILENGLETELTLLAKTCLNASF